MSEVQKVIFAGPWNAGLLTLCRAGLGYVCIHETQKTVVADITEIMARPVRKPALKKRRNLWSCFWGARQVAGPVLSAWII
jgi:hypothetical protein